MEKDVQKSVHTLLALFGLLIALIVIFMLTGDITPSIQFSASHESSPNAAASTDKEPKKVIRNADAPLPVVLKQDPAPIVSQAIESQKEEDELNAETMQEPVLQKSSTIKAGSCALEEGTHKATVTYTDIESGRSGTYKLDVIVLNCQIIAIDFRKGEWLDHDNFGAADIDEHGNASLEDNRGRLFDIHISK